MNYQLRSYLDNTPIKRSNSFNESLSRARSSNLFESISNQFNSSNNRSYSKKISLFENNY